MHGIQHLLSNMLILHLYDLRAVAKLIYNCNYRASDEANIALYAVNVMQLEVVLL